PTGPPGTQLMNVIVEVTFNVNGLIEIIEILDKRLYDKGNNWRHVTVQTCLPNLLLHARCHTVLDHLLHPGSRTVVIIFRDNVDKYGKDFGVCARAKAKDITRLLVFALARRYAWLACARVG
ncbi:hypothetical protein V8E53_006084, partial [Lactarius tabidus]